MSRKYFFLVALLVFALGTSLAAFVACGDDDDDDNDNDVDDDADDDSVDDDTADDDTTDDDTADDDTGDDDVAEDVKNPAQTECLSGKDDYTEVEYAEIHFADGTLTVERRNICRNCAFDFQGTYVIEGNDITVLEADIDPAWAFCDCFYNIEYEIPGIEAGGTYQFTINGVDIKDNPDAVPWLIMSETLDLSVQTDFEFDLGEHVCI